MLRARGSEDVVVSLGDCLAFGPVASGDWGERAKAQVPIYAGWDWIINSAASFLEGARAGAAERLVWLAPRSASEQCGLQWYFEQIRGSVGPMIIADHPLSGGWRDAPPLGLGELPHRQIAELLDNSPRREWPVELASPEPWRKLRTDDSLLRVIEDGVLRSVPPSYFDDFLLN